MIFGHELVAVQRVRMPARGVRARCRASRRTRRRPRARARAGPTRPPGKAKRRLRSVTRAAMFGLAPSHTMRFCSSRLKPSMMRSLTNVPDCDVPSIMPHFILPATGLAVPEVVGRRVAQERVDVARRRKTDAGDDGVVHRIEELVQLVRVEAVLETDALGDRACPGKAPCGSPRRPSRRRESRPRRPARLWRSPTRWCSA